MIPRFTSPTQFFYPNSITCLAFPLEWLAYISNLTTPELSIFHPTRPALSHLFYQGIAAVHADMILLSPTPRPCSALVGSNSCRFLSIILLEAVPASPELWCSLMWTKQQSPRRIPCLTLASSIQSSVRLNLTVYWFTWKHTCKLFGTWVSPPGILI